MHIELSLNNDCNKYKNEETMDDRENPKQIINELKQKISNLKKYINKLRDNH